MLTADELADLRTDVAAKMKDSVTFKKTDGTTALGPVICRVVPSRQRGEEGPRGVRTTSMARFDIIVPANTAVNEAWRAHVTGVDTGAVSVYHVIAVDGPHTDEIERRLQCEKAQN